MRHIKVIITRTVIFHGEGLSMATVVERALDMQLTEPSRVEIVAHDVFEDDDE